jgi:O-antigen/teichoic acid export membrane protein
MTEEAAAGGTPSLRAGGMRVAIGLALLGLTTYVLLAVAARVLGPARYADFAVFWGVVYGVGLGAFLPFEQEVGRRVAVRAVHGEEARPVLGAALRLGGLMVLALAAVMLVVVPFVSPGGLAHEAGFWLTTVAAFAGLMVAYVSRGALAGTHRFGRYAAQLATEGGVRLVGCVLLGALAVTSLGAWTSLVAVALVAAVVVTSRPSRSPWSGPRLGLRDLGASMAALIVCAGVSQSLINFGPALVRVVGRPADEELTGRFLAAALVTRLPVFAFAAIQAVLMPHLSAAVARDDRASFRRSLVQVLAPTAALGAVGVLASAAAGPWVLGLLGPTYTLPRRDIVLLALPVALYLLTLALQPAATSLRGHGAAAAVWGVAALVFAVACFLPLDALLAVEVGLVAAYLVAVAGLLLIVTRRASRLGRQPAASRSAL